MSVDYRCNKCGKLFVDNAPENAPSKTALVVTECADCAPPEGANLTKFYDKDCRRLDAETRRHYAPEEVMSA